MLRTADKRLFVGQRVSDVFPHRLMGGMGQYGALLDNFNRANEAPLSGGGNWAKLNSATAGQMNLTSNQVLGSSADFHRYYWTPQDFGPDVEAWLTMAADPSASREYTVLARLQGAGGSNTWDGYEHEMLRASGTDSHALYVVTNGTRTSIASASREMTVGENLGIRCVGDQIQGWIQNGGVWTMVLSATNAVYGAAGKVGMGGESTAFRIDDFSAGTIG